MRTDLASKPQAGADHHRQGHPHDPFLGLDTDRVSLNLPQVAGLLDQRLLDGLALDASTCPPTGDRPLVEAEGDDNRLQWTAVCQERDHEGDRRARSSQAVKCRAFRAGKSLMARCAEEPLVLRASACEYFPGQLVLWRDTPDWGRMLLRDPWPFSSVVC